MDKTIEKRIENVLELQRIRALIQADDISYEEMIEAIKTERLKRKGIAYCPDNPEAIDSPEG